MAPTSQQSTKVADFTAKASKNQQTTATTTTTRTIRTTAGIEYSQEYDK